jgi:hypothetical protein
VLQKHSPVIYIKALVSATVIETGGPGWFSGIPNVDEECLA